MSFEIIKGSYKNTGGSGFLIGYNNFDDILDRMVSQDPPILTQEEADDMALKYDGYQLQIDGYDSVNYFLAGNIEAICMHSRNVGGGHCAGLKYTTTTNVGEPWGIWFTTEQFIAAKDFDEELQGVDISD